MLTNTSQFFLRFVRESCLKIDEFYDSIIRYSLELMTIENINLKRSLQEMKEKMPSVRPTSQETYLRTILW